LHLENCLHWTFENLHLEWAAGEKNRKFLGRKHPPPTYPKHECRVPIAAEHRPGAYRALRDRKSMPGPLKPLEYTYVNYL
jgi:hypothetical protein